MTYRRKKKNTFDSNLVFYAAIAFFAIYLCSVAYSSCSKNENEKRLTESAYGVELTSLTHVVTPELKDARHLSYPGFDILFSNMHKQPYYVTWILTPEYAAANNVARSDKFRPDPDVPNSAQLSDYKRSGYDRGHMAPAGDFKWSQEAQDATFFLTNMSPQANSLNSGAWANLEDQCRSWALRDSTLVIVTGPILSDYLTKTIGESKVTVPSRYFKVVYAPYANPPRAIGFVMPNQYVEGGVQATAMSVDEVEEITGFDFFSSLPDELENTIESEAKYSQWQFSKKKKKK